MAKSNKIVVILDPITRGLIIQNNYLSLMNHATVLSDIKELTVDNTESHLVVFATYLHTGTTLSALDDCCISYNLTLHILYSDENDIILESKYDLVKCDYITKLDWNLIYAVVNQDYAILESYQIVRDKFSGLTELRSHIPADYQDNFDTFRKSYLSLMTSQSNMIEQISNMSEMLSANSEINHRMLMGVRKLRGYLEAYRAKVLEYEAMLSGIVDVQVDGFYPARPKVLYIKQYFHVSGADILLNMLYYTITRQYCRSCKIIKLMDTSSSFSVQYLPSSYVILKDSYKTSGLLQNDFVAKIGSYKIMLDFLLLNRSALDILIIHDMRSVSNCALSESNTDLILAEMTSDYAVLGSQYSILSDSSKVSEYYWTHKDYLDFDSKEVQRLTGHPTIAAILESLR